MKNKIENSFFHDLFKVLKNLEYIKSANIVGSILNKNLDEISDLDLVVIIDKLSVDKLQEIEDIILSFNYSNYGFTKPIKLNKKFGPIKYDYKNNHIIHLMIYDLENHKKHVYDSPFTCFDWERTSIYSKKHIGQFHPVYKLMFNDFINARRGLLNYINNLKNSSLEYREYQIDNDSGIKLQTNHLIINERDKNEFSYHICKNLIFNYLKFVSKKNEDFEENFIKEFQAIEPLFFEKNKSIFNLLEKGKKLFLQNENYIVQETINFVDNFYDHIKHVYDKSLKIYFIRHFETKLNNGTFLGQKLDPTIISKQNSKNILKDINYKEVYSSPSLRCKDSLKSVGIKNFEIDKNLKEIDYGDAEGLELDQLKERYPKIVEEWSNGNDVSFPNGENTQDVHKRVSESLTKVKKNTLFMTHQVPIRCMVGEFFDLDIKEWFKIKIPFGTPLEFIKLQNKYYLNITQTLKKEILEDI